jgi:hypothetical protein
VTRALRRTHRRVVSALALALPGAIAVALAARPAPSAPAPLGVAALDAPAAPLRNADWEGRAGDPSLALVARLGTLDADATTPALDLDVRSRHGQPETLAYWSARDAGSALPDDAILLGPVDVQRTQRLVLPAAARSAAGVLLLYRIAQGTVIARLALPAADLAADGARS